MLIVWILSLLGLVYLSKFAFFSKSNDNTSYTVDNFDHRKIVLSRLTIVLLWINLAFMIVAILWSGAHL